MRIGRAKRLRLNYDRSLFGMKFSDAESLSMCLENTVTLVSLRCVRLGCGVVI